MKLDKIKLSGFKSFVDATTIPIHSNLTAIVGPNGCGKSNIIDAVRWVMGESSAKHLRGGNMTDVIFNGSSERKPVSTASVELVFNNTERKLGGEYAQYDSIAIKRQVSRDGQSLFMLNGARCRRKDITDLFLGTGLGSRSYAIIEQGMISRIVEAKPEELRTYIEEAAGVSKYKERRSETETRMKHTRENLERLNDLREEVERQLKTLEKQAEKAEKYIALRKQERNYKLELLAMRWQAYEAQRISLTEQAQQAAAEHNRVFSALRTLETDLQQKRLDHKNHQQHLNQAQGEFYAAASALSTLEQAIKHAEKSHADTNHEVMRSSQQLQQFQNELAIEVQQRDAIKLEQLSTEQRLDLAQEELDDQQAQVAETQQAQTETRQQWQQQLHVTARHREALEVQRMLIAQLNQQRQSLQQRLTKLEAERDLMTHEQDSEQIERLTDHIEYLSEQRDNTHSEFSDLQQQIIALRKQSKHHHDDLHQLRSSLQHTQGQITSLELLQQHAMGKDNDALNSKLHALGLAELPRLAEQLDVEPGWETALEAVLSHRLQALCIPELNRVSTQLSQFAPDDGLMFVSHNTAHPTASQTVPATALLAKIKSPVKPTSLLTGVYCAENHASALALVTELANHESVITPDAVWFGVDWLQISRTSENNTGVLQREKQLRTLKQQHTDIEQRIRDAENQLDACEHALLNTENTREQLQHQHNQLATEISQKHAELSAQSAKLEQQQRRWQQIRQELDDTQVELEQLTTALMSAEALKQQADDLLTEAEQRKQEIEDAQQQQALEYRQLEQVLAETRQRVYQAEAALEHLHTNEAASEKQIARLQQLQAQTQAHIAVLQEKLAQTNAPLTDDKQRLQQLKDNKSQLERRLIEHRHTLERLENDIIVIQEQQARLQRESDQHRNELDRLKFELQESEVRRQTVLEQLQELDAEPGQILNNLSEQANEPQWKRQLDELAGQIERLGTINLTAVEDYRSQSERMRFLNEQHTDLITALTTLEQAINKIDKESRLRFKETFDKINSGLQKKFPKLFGGGQAYLELTEQDLLESGVTIIARPPGKKNTSIHLLSGGEKALTAVALVFSIFELNPAPFCLLDEVDAPLDEANVGRFSKMVEAMSTTVQFLFISHNKVTMEIAQQLAGVTMKEPGVSRMVAVDIEEAVSLSES